MPLIFIRRKTCGVFDRESKYFSFPNKIGNPQTDFPNGKVGFTSKKIRFLDFMCCWEIKNPYFIIQILISQWRTPL